jgi:hypothetical protein
MSNKVFQDMTEIERRNKYGHFIWNHAGEQIKQHGEEPPLFEDTDTVDYTKLLMLFRSNASLYDKLGRFLIVKGDQAWLTSDSVFSAYINSGEKMQFQYAQIINTLKDFIDDEFSKFGRKDVEKILKGFKELDEAHDKYFNRIKFEKTSEGRYSSLIGLTKEGDPPPKLARSIHDTNIKIYKQHKELEDLIENYKSRQEVVGRGAIPRKYM